MTYLLISAVFLAVAVLVLVVALAVRPDRARLVRRGRPAAAIAGIVLAVLTAVFDNAMIAAGLMTYAGHATSGVRLGLVPVEDFAYPLAGLVLLPALWLLLGRRRSGPTGARRATRHDGDAG